MLKPTCSIHNYQRTQQEMHLSYSTFPFPCFGIFAFSVHSPYEIAHSVCIYCLWVMSLIYFCCLWSLTTLFDSVKCLFPHQLHFLIIAHLNVKLYSDLYLLLSGDLICLVQHVTYFYCLFRATQWALTFMVQRKQTSHTKQHIQCDKQKLFNIYSSCMLWVKRGSKRESAWWRGCRAGRHTKWFNVSHSSSFSE